LTIYELRLIVGYEAALDWLISGGFVGWNEPGQMKRSGIRLYWVGWSGGKAFAAGEGLLCGFFRSLRA
jgi:hypothetical protein